MRSCCLLFDRAPRRAFTLLEVLVTLTILIATFGVTAQFLGLLQRSWQSAAADPFADAEKAFERVTHALSAATLEPYDDYADAHGVFRATGDTAFVPDHVARRSDLAFVCGPALLAGTARTTASSSVFFVAPAGRTQLEAETGLDRLLDAEGYFVEFGGETDAPGFYAGAPRLRWRLKAVAQPSESLQVFGSTASAPWIAQMTAESAPVSVLADNVIALVVLPERSATDTGGPLAPEFAYDSRDTTNATTCAQLPPRLRVVLAAIDEVSAGRLAARDGTQAPPLIPATLFQDWSKLDADVTTLDDSLTAAKIGHRFFEREITVAAAAWSDTP